MSRYLYWLLAALTLVSRLGTIDAAQAQVSVQVGGHGDVRVNTGSSSVSVVDGKSRIRTTPNWSDSGSVIQQQSSYSQSSSAINQSHQTSAFDLDSEDLRASSHYLIARALPGQSLRGTIRVNGRTFYPDRGSLVVPLNRLLKPGTNRIDFRGLSAGYTSLVSSRGGLGFLNGRLVGADRILVQQSQQGQGIVNQTILVTLR
ncbi:MAG: hypothetical protein H7Y22_16890 [Gemmatimonadaceae bacterium]|nr:hypothetical protein [Gloeobacterales cyanobacterium ES-bin-141]